MAKYTDEEIAAVLRQHGTGAASRILGLDERSLRRRRQKLEQKLDQPVRKNDDPERHGTHRIQFNVDDGLVMIASDAHYWPGIITTAHRGFVKLVNKLKPCAVIMNGDVVDGSQISRHPPIGWESTPLVHEEIAASQARLREIINAHKRARHIWTLGNHDARFATRLASVASEYRHVYGVHLYDHFPEWERAWSVWINDSVVVKHRIKGGIHATHNNTLWSGKTTVTGHLHSLKVCPYSDYNGTRYGIDSGTLADPGGPQFIDYTEDGPTNWRSGFIVLKFRNGRLHYPEIAQVWAPNQIEFRGEIIEV